MEYKVRNVNEALSVIWHDMHKNDPSIMVRESRNGPVLEATEPVVITYTRPRERVLFHPDRDANPFFHLFESIWMLAGRSDVAWLAKFNKQMLQYSDDGKTLRSNYGARWNLHLNTILDRLRWDPNGRRAYIPIYEPRDVPHDGKDTPCNLGITFYVRDNKLDMNVFNRSNDMLWGALGANVVHFSFLQEYVAALAGLEVGKYSQISTCFHIYTEFPVYQKMTGKVDPHPLDPYEAGRVVTSGIRILSSRTASEWQKDAAFFLNRYTDEDDEEDGNVNEWWWAEPFFQRIAVPMYKTWRAWKAKEWDKAFLYASSICADDWRCACRMWLDRRR